MNNRIAKALIKLFESQRIVFWYDTKRELRQDFEELSLPEVEKIELKNNEFKVKHQILREQPEQKFLLYHEGASPADLDNWLLDVQLGNVEFKADLVSIWLSELDLGQELIEVVKDHIEFYQSIKRRELLKGLVKPDDTRGQIRLKMLAICTGSEPRIDEILKNLLQELAEGQDEKINLISRCQLEDFFWEQINRFYEYTSAEPGIHDFVIELFKSCYAMGTEGKIQLNRDALVFLKSWKDSRQFEQGFETLSGECAEVLNIEQDIAKIDFRELIELDYFRLIDQKIISDLAKAAADRVFSSDEIELWVTQRRQSHWYQEYNHLYEAIGFAASFLNSMGEVNLTMGSLADGVQRYCHFWFRIDQLYRKFIYHVRKSGQASIMSTLADQIENLYVNNYLLKVNDRWQSIVDNASRWEAPPVILQKNFFDHWVQPFLRKNNKVIVIISDALRFEIGDELLSLIRQEDRYSAELECALSMLPSYTQLGMAALLPNKSLVLAENETGTVFVDGISSQGTDNRQKILRKSITQMAAVLKSDTLKALKGDECRALVRDHDVIYIYHNHIDAVGDNRDMEEQVFEAVEETLRELILIIKKLAGANANNLLITSDHGFIFQNRAIEESDFSGISAEGESILFRDRRFVLGKGLKEISGLRKFASSEIGLDGDVEVQIPKSINRLRLKGAGSRFVHGGAALQEVVIPVLKINKKRKSDISIVDVDILQGASSLISAGQIAVVFYQSQAVTEKVQPRKVRAGIYTLTGDLISDRHDLIFDQASENPRERELKVRFILTHKADEVNSQEVVLKLEEKHAGTSHFTEYKSLRYILRRSFTSDFDF